MPRDLFPRDSPRGMTRTSRDLRPGLKRAPGPGHLPHTACCKAHRDGAGSTWTTVPSSQLPVGLALSSTLMALATAAACTCEQNRFLSTLGGDV